MQTKTTTDPLSRAVEIAGLILSGCIIAAEIVSRQSFGLLGDLAMGIFLFTCVHLFWTWFVS